MTEQPDGGTDKPVATLQPLDFHPISDDGQVASYQALAGDQGAPTGDQGAPGSAEFAVTVTIASSVQPGPGIDINELLGGMKAAFAILPEPPPDNGGSGGEAPPGTGEPPPIEEPFDINKHVRFEFSLVNYGGSRPVDVAVTVQKTTFGGADIEKFLPRVLPAGLRDYWCAKNVDSINASVTVNDGTGTISPPPTPVYARPQSFKFKAKTIIVQAGPNSITYSMSANFRLARHNVLP